MSTWSGTDSNNGSMTFSRHWSERLEAVADPLVSNWVVAGNKYTLRFLLTTSPSAGGIAAMAAVALGYGSTTTKRSNLFIARFISRPRVCELGACPQKNKPLTLVCWSIMSFFSSTASTQRETVVPDFSIMSGA